MRGPESFEEIYLYRNPVDMRKYRNGLCQIIATELGMDVYTPTLFVFTNKTKRIIRALYWDETGFAVWSKTLDKDKYRWPLRRFSGSGLHLSADDLMNLLKGMDISVHKNLEYRKTF